MAEPRSKQAAKTATRSSAKGKSEGAAKKPARPRRSAKSRAVEEHVRSYFEAIARHDIDAVASYWSPDGVEDIVPQGVYRGPEEISGMFRDLVASTPDLETKVSRVVADDRHAVVEWRMSGTFSGAPFMGLEPTGKPVELRGLDIFEVEDQKILRNTAYYDGASFARQIGMLPAQDSGAERAMKSAFNAVTRARRAVNERMNG
jgi:steroid delta-isomerase-like uncharacterized protein